MRNRIVILLGVIVGAVFIAWFVFLPKESARTVGDAGARVEKPEAQALPPPIATTDPTPTAAPTPSPGTSSSAVAIAEAAAPAVPVVPEPLPEIDAFSKMPPGSDRWTPEEREHYRDGLFEKLARREAQLEREVAAGDASTTEQKRATLALLRARRDEILAGTRTRPPRADAEPEL